MKNNSYINFDSNAGWGVDPEIWHYLEAVLKDCINPSSVHQAGQKAKFLIEEARQDIKNLLDAKDSRVIFTSGASEANNLILNSVFNTGALIKDGHLLISAVEHMSLVEPAKKLTAQGLGLTLLVPPTNSAYSSDDFLNALKPDTKMVSMMYANNETGDVLPAIETAKKIKSIRPDILFHSDAVQAPGKVKYSFAESFADAISISGHKLGALPGVGALIIKSDVDVRPFILGGPQESRFRAGTENLPGIVSFGYVARKIAEGLEKRSNQMRENTEVLKKILFENIAGIEQNKFAQDSLPNTLNIYIPSIRADDLVVALDLQGILISSAAACSSGKPMPSHVLLSHGLSEERARSSIRLSLTDNDSKDIVEEAAKKIIECVNLMRIRTQNSQVESHAG